MPASPARSSARSNLSTTAKPNLPLATPRRRSSRSWKRRGSAARPPTRPPSRPSRTGTTCASASGALVPTYVGMAVTHLLRDHFGQYIDLGFTARMEDSLDDIATGEAESRRFLDVLLQRGRDRPGLVRRRSRTRCPASISPQLPLGADPKRGRPSGSGSAETRSSPSGAKATSASRPRFPMRLLIDELTVERARELLEIRGPGAVSTIGTDPGTGCRSSSGSDRSAPTCSWERRARGATSRVGSGSPRGWRRPMSPWTTRFEASLASA